MLGAVRCRSMQSDVRSQAKPMPIAHYRQTEINNLNVEWKAKATGSQNAMAYGYSKPYPDRNHATYIPLKEALPPEDAHLMGLHHT